VIDELCYTSSVRSFLQSYLKRSDVPSQEEFAQPGLSLTLSVEPHVGTGKQDMNCGMQRLKQKSSCQTEVREASYSTTLSVS
jgi:hypothetical protein